MKPPLPETFMADYIHSVLTLASAINISSKSQVNFEAALVLVTYTFFQRRDSEPLDYSQTHAAYRVIHRVKGDISTKIRQINDHKEG